MQDDFGAKGMAPQEFLQAFVNAYNIPSMESSGYGQWQYLNRSEGWEVAYGSYLGGVIKISAVFTDPKFN